MHVCVDHQKAVLEQTVADRAYPNAYIRAYNDYLQGPAKDEDSNAHTDRLIHSGYPQQQVLAACRDHKAKRFIKKATRKYYAVGLTFTFDYYKVQCLRSQRKRRRKRKTVLRLSQLSCMYVIIFNQDFSTFVLKEAKTIRMDGSK